VHLDGLNGGERIKCKPSNAKLVSGTLDLGAAVEMAAAAARMRAKVPNDASFGQEPQKKFQEREYDRPQESARREYDRPQEFGRREYDRPLDSGRREYDRPQDSGRRDYDRPQDTARGSFERSSGRRDGDRDRDRDQGRRQDRRAERSRSRPRSSTGPPELFSGANNVTLRNGTVEDRARDWVCQKCGERNFAKRNNCYSCGAPRTSDAPSYRDVSHILEQQRKAQQQRAPRPMGGGHGEWTTAKEMLGQADWDALRRKIDNRSESSSSSSSSSSSEASDRKRKKRNRSRSSSASADKSTAQPASSVAKPNPELDKLKNEALQRLLKIRDEPPETRKRSWRALLLEWHPDKHTEGRENATAVFQFLQKGKTLLDLKSAS